MAVRQPRVIQNPNRPWRNSPPTVDSRPLVAVDSNTSPGAGRAHSTAYHSFDRPNRPSFSERKILRIFNSFSSDKIACSYY